MAKIVREIAVDVAKKNTFQAIVAKQCDRNSRFLKVTLCNEGKKIPVEPHASVLFSVERADREVKAFAGTVNGDGTVTVPLTGWALALDAPVRCEVSVIDAAGKRLTSTAFSIEVERTTYTGEGIEEDGNYDPLVVLLAEVASAKAACETAAKTANASAATANASAATANAAAANASNAAKTATEAAQSAAKTASAAAQSAVEIANAAAENAVEIANGAAESALQVAGKAANAADVAARNASYMAELASGAAEQAGKAAEKADKATAAANAAAGSANAAASYANAAASEALKAAERAESIVIADGEGALHLGKLRVESDHLVLDITQLQGG